MLSSLFKFSTTMYGTGVVRSSVLVTLITTFLTLSQSEVTSAKAIGLEQDYWSNTGEIDKRNSWWSKKSLESAPDYQRFLQESSYKDIEQDSNAETEPESNISSLYSCYVQSCAPEFVNCAKSSRTRQEFAACKARHHLCALQCWVDLTESKFV